MNLIPTATVSENVAIHTANNHHPIESEWELKIILQAYAVLLQPSIRRNNTIDKSIGFDLQEAITVYRRINRNQLVNTLGI